MNSGLMKFSLLLLAALHVTNSFIVSPQHASPTRVQIALKAKSSRAEWSVVNAEEEDNDDDGKRDYDLSIVDNTTSDDHVVNELAQDEEFSDALEYAALLPSGQANHVLQVQVGNLSLARKAWKKRRRSGSPLLVPCSILNLDRTTMLRWNCIYLLYKFGSAQKDGVVMSLDDLTKRHKSHLKGQLMVSAYEYSLNSWQFPRYDSSHQLLLA
jgi:hypothetical protein